MEYRTLPHGGEQISIIGLGTTGIASAGEQSGREAMSYALEKGVNYIDMAASLSAAFPIVGASIAGARKNVYLQIHFGADYTAQSGKYGWTTDLELIKRSIDWQLQALRTDYIDFGFIHCIDEESDLNAYLSAGILDYVKSLKAQGTVRHIGISTHTPRIAQTVLDLGVLDMMMFSVNPGYDLQRMGKHAVGNTDERMDLYRRCQREGVAISVMKAFSGGQLLDAKTSPFGQALTQTQCIQYALDRPGVVTVLPGCRNKEDVERVLEYLESTPEERDYSILGSLTPRDLEGTCIYCNHCQPCPAGLDVGLMNKYYDLARAGDDLAKGHYEKLPVHAEECLRCGHCESRCPFHVKQEARMEEIAAYFGK